MRGLYQLIEELNPDNRNMIVTVVEGEHLGEKALFSNKQLIWESNPQGFFSAHRAAVSDNLWEQMITLCGNTLFYELLTWEKKLVICGGGHVALSLIQLGHTIGFPVTVLEDRPAFADHAREAGARQVICDSFENGLARIPGDSDTFFVIATRDHRYDSLCLKLISNKKHAYIGMIGSQRKVGIIKETLLAEGTDQTVLDQLHAPIGVDIHAETPSEIAISIAAEIISVKNSQNLNCGYTRELKQALLQTQENKKKAVLATIIRRQGSAPRKTGTKMLIFPDRHIVGTIGGGYAEAKVIQKAVEIMHNEDTLPLVFQIDANGNRSEKEGMICGGLIELMLERV